MSLVGETQGGKTTILQHLLVHGLVTPQQYTELHAGVAVPAEPLEAFDLSRYDAGIHVGCIIQDMTLFVQARCNARSTSQKAKLA